MMRRAHGESMHLRVHNKILSFRDVIYLFFSFTNVKEKKNYIRYINSLLVSLSDYMWTT